MHKTVIWLIRQKCIKRSPQRNLTTIPTPVGLLLHTPSRQAFQQLPSHACHLCVCVYKNKQINTCQEVCFFISSTKNVARYLYSFTPCCLPLITLARNHCISIHRASSFIFTLCACCCKNVPKLLQQICYRGNLSWCQCFVTVNNVSI